MTEQKKLIQALLHAVNRMSDVELARVWKEGRDTVGDHCDHDEEWSRQKTIDYINRILS